MMNYVSIRILILAALLSIGLLVVNYCWVPKPISFSPVPSSEETGLNQTKNAPSSSRNIITCQHLVACKRLFVQHLDATYHVYDSSNGKYCGDLPKFPERLSCVAQSTASCNLAVVYCECKPAINDLEYENAAIVKIFDPITLQEISSRQVLLDEKLRAVAISARWVRPDSLALVATFNDFSGHTMSVLYFLNTVDLGVSRLSDSFLGSSIYVVSHDRAMITDSLRKTRRLSHGGIGIDNPWSPGPSLIDSKNLKIVCRLFDSIGIQDYVVGIDWSDDGMLIAGVTAKHHVLVARSDTGKSIAALESVDDWITSIKFVGEAKIAIGCNNASLHIWDYKSGKLESINCHTKGINLIEVNKSSRDILTASEDGTVCILSDDHESKKRIWHDGPVRELEKLSDGLFISRSVRGQAKVWCVDGSLQKEFKTEPRLVRFGSAYIDSLTGKVVSYED